MKKILNGADTYADETLTGMCAAFLQFCRRSGHSRNAGDVAVAMPEADASAAAEDRGKRNGLARA